MSGSRGTQRWPSQPWYGTLVRRLSAISCSIGAMPSPTLCRISSARLPSSILFLDQVQVRSLIGVGALQCNFEHLAQFRPQVSDAAANGLLGQRTQVALILGQPEILGAQQGQGERGDGHVGMQALLFVDGLYLHAVARESDDDPAGIDPLVAQYLGIVLPQLSVHVLLDVRDSPVGAESLRDDAMGDDGHLALVLPVEDEAVVRIVRENALDVWRAGPYRHQVRDDRPGPVE